MRKAAWWVVGAAFVAGCGGSGGTSPATSAADVVTEAGARADASEMVMDGGATDAGGLDALADAAIDDASAAMEHDATASNDAGPSYLADANFPDSSAYRCTVEPDDGGDLNCCAIEPIRNQCICGSQTLAFACASADAGLGPSPSCYDIQQAFAQGVCY